MRWWDGSRWTDVVGGPAGPGGPVAATSTLPREVPPGAAGQPPEPKKPRLWIIWVVLGVIVLGVLIAAVVLIPLLFAASGLGGQAGNGAVADSDQRAALATVDLYDDAWQNADCDAYFASTTEGFRAESGLTDCSAFETAAEEFSAAAEDYEVEVTDIRAEGDDILVATTETYTALVDEDGETLDDPVEESIDWVYIVVADGDDRLIDNIR